MLFTDYGDRGPYIGQVIAAISRIAPEQRIVVLFSDAPTYNPVASSYLLSAYVRDFPEHTVFFCVIDPRVGSSKQRSLIIKVDGRWFVGPDNGLLNVVAKHGTSLDCWEIVWRPAQLSSSFHGRDLYAPVAARLAIGKRPEGDFTSIATLKLDEVPDDLFEVIYVDYFGNAMTGIRASVVSKDMTFSVNGTTVANARTFSDVPSGSAFWYENSNGLVEIAVNLGRASEMLGINIGEKVEVVPR